MGPVTCFKTPVTKGYIFVDPLGSEVFLCCFLKKEDEVTRLLKEVLFENYTVVV